MAITTENHECNHIKPHISILVSSFALDPSPSETISPMEFLEDENVSRRVYATVSDAIALDLDRWAEAEFGTSKKATTLAGQIITEAVRKAKADGRIPPETVVYESLAQLVSHHLKLLVESGKFEQRRLRALMAGDRPTEIELLRIALLCNLTEEDVTRLVEQS